MLTLHPRTVKHDRDHRLLWVWLVGTVWLGAGPSLTTALAYKGPLFPPSLRQLLSQQPASEARLRLQLQRATLHPSWTRRLPGADLRRLRNTIFALRGARFRSPDLQRFFAQQPWYKPQRATGQVQLSTQERTNLKLLLEAERQSRPPRPQDPAPKMIWGAAAHFPAPQKALCLRSLIHQARQWRHHSLAYYVFKQLKIIRYKRYWWARIKLSNYLLHPLPRPGRKRSSKPRKRIAIQGGYALLIGRSCTRWKVLTYGTKDVGRKLPSTLRQRLGL